MATKAQLQAEVARLTKENLELVDRFEQMKTRAVHIFLETREGYLYLEHNLDDKTTFATGFPHVAIDWVFEILHMDIEKLQIEIDKLIAK